MKSFIEKEKIELPLTFGSSQKVDLIVENAHFLGDYEASKNGELVIGTLKINDAALCSLTGDEYFSAEELARYAIEWAGSDQAKHIIAQFEDAQSWLLEGEKDASVKETEQYAQSKVLSENLERDYIQITNTLIYTPHLYAFLQNCKKERDVEKMKNSAKHGILSMEDRDSFRGQFRFIYEKEPTEEQLDIFIAFMFGIETDVEKVRRVCDGESYENQAQPNA